MGETLGSRKVPLPAAAAVLAAAIAATLAQVSQPLGIAVGAMLVLFLTTMPLGRLVVVVGGAILVFQSSEGVSAPKLAYLGLLALCAAVSWVRVHALIRADPRFRSFRALPGLSLILVGYLATTLVIAGRNGIAQTEWARDVIAYLLMAVAPLIALDAVLNASLRAIQFVVMTVGIAAALLFMVTWLGRRGFQVVDNESVALASMTLCVLPFCYALIKTLKPGRHRIGWMALAGTIPAALLVTGTRTTFVLGTALVGMAGSRKKMRVSPATVLVVALLGGAAVVYLIPALALAVTGDPQFFGERFGSLGSLLDGGTVYDESYRQRQLAYNFTRDVWHLHFWLGTGPGYYFNNVDPSKPATLSLDSPYLVLAKFGVLGASLMVGYVVAVFAMVFRCRRETGYTVELTAVRMTVPVLFALVPFGPLLNDKGFALMLALCVALVGATVTNPRQATATVTSRIRPVVPDAPQWKYGPR